MKNLEQYIRDNKQAFDDKSPDRSIWLSIEGELNRKEKTWIIAIKPWKAAAATVLVLSCGVLIGLNFRSDKTQLDYARNKDFEQFKDTENYYQTQVNLKLSEINDPQAKINVMNDLKQLDEIYSELKAEIIRSGYTNSDIILEAMIKNQKTKTEILENILNKQNQIKNENLSL